MRREIKNDVKKRCRLVVADTIRTRGRGRGEKRFMRRSARVTFGNRPITYLRWSRVTDTNDDGLWPPWKNKKRKRTERIKKKTNKNEGPERTDPWHEPLDMIESRRTREKRCDCDKRIFSEGARSATFPRDPSLLSFGVFRHKENFLACNLP